jgi:hypothetical protein
MALPDVLLIKLALISLTLTCKECIQQCDARTTTFQQVKVVRTDLRSTCLSVLDDRNV